MAEVNYILTTMTDRSLIIIDELCRSTSVEQGTATAMMICDKLARSRAYTFVTTHFTLLTKLADLFFNIKVWQLQTVPSGNPSNPKAMKLDFKFTLVPGATSLRGYGIYMVRGIWPPEVLTHVDELQKRYTKKNRDPKFPSLDKGARLTYDLDCKVKKLELQKKLTLFNLNKHLNEYHSEMQKLGEEEFQYSQHIVQQIQHTMGEVLTELQHSIFDASANSAASAEDLPNVFLENLGDEDSLTDSPSVQTEAGRPKGEECLIFTPVGSQESVLTPVISPSKAKIRMQEIFTPDSELDISASAANIIDHCENFEPEIVLSYNASQCSLNLTQQALELEDGQTSQDRSTRDARYRAINTTQFLQPRNPSKPPPDLTLVRESSFISSFARPLQDDSRKTSTPLVTKIQLNAKNLGTTTSLSTSSTVSRRDARDVTHVTTPKLSFTIPGDAGDLDIASMVEDLESFVQEIEKSENDCEDESAKTLRENTNMFNHQHIFPIVTIIQGPNNPSSEEDSTNASNDALIIGRSDVENIIITDASPKIPILGEPIVPEENSYESNYQRDNNKMDIIIKDTANKEIEKNQQTLNHDIDLMIEAFNSLSKPKSSNNSEPSINEEQGDKRTENEDKDITDTRHEEPRSEDNNKAENDLKEKSIDDNVTSNNTQQVKHSKDIVVEEICKLKEHLEEEIDDDVYDTAQSSMELSYSPLVHTQGANPPVGMTERIEEIIELSSKTSNNNQQVKHSKDIVVEENCKLNEHLEEEIGDDIYGMGLSYSALVHTQGANPPVGTTERIEEITALSSNDHDDNAPENKENAMRSYQTDFEKSTEIFMASQCHQNSLDDTETERCVNNQSQVRGETKSDVVSDIEDDMDIVRKYSKKIGHKPIKTENVLLFEMFNKITEEVGNRSCLSDNPTEQRKNDLEKGNNVEEIMNEKTDTEGDSKKQRATLGMRLNKSLSRIAVAKKPNTKTKSKRKEGTSHVSARARENGPVKKIKLTDDRSASVSDSNKSDGNKETTSVSEASKLRNLEGDFSSSSSPAIKDRENEAVGSSLTEASRKRNLDKEPDSSTSRCSNDTSSGTDPPTHNRRKKLKTFNPPRKKGDCKENESVCSNQTDVAPKQKLLSDSGQQTSKFVYPSRLSQKAIREAFFEQDKKFFERSDSDSVDLTKMWEERLKRQRPTPKQIQQSTCLATIRKTNEGVEVIPATKKKTRAHGTQNKTVNMTMFSDRNAQTFDQFIKSDTKDYKSFNFKFGRADEDDGKLFDFKQVKTVSSEYTLNSQSWTFVRKPSDEFKLASQPNRSVDYPAFLTPINDGTLTPEGFYKQNKDDIASLLKKYN